MQMSFPSNSCLPLIIAATNRYSCSVLQRTRCQFLSYVDLCVGTSLIYSACITPRRANLWKHRLLVQWIRPFGCKLLCLPPFIAPMCIHMQRHVFRLFCQSSRSSCRSSGDVSVSCHTNSIQRIYCTARRDTSLLHLDILDQPLRVDLPCCCG